MRIPPPWEKPAPEAVPRDNKGRFPPGVSGNPAGKPVGAIGRRAVLEQQLADAVPGIQEVVIAAAMGGDMTAAGLVLTRVHPPLRARAERVRFDLDPSKPLSDQAQQVVVAVASGDVDPETGKMMVEVIASLAGIRSVDEVQKQIDELKRHLNVR